MAYYTSNAIYERLFSQGKTNYHWVSENAWILVYGDDNFTPKVIVLAFNNHWIKEAEIIRQTCNIAKSANLPMLQIGFDCTKETIDSVNVAHFDSVFNCLLLNDLTALFESFGLSVQNGITAKAINSAASSAYHNWQRNNLGRNIVVADIDLMKIKDDGTIIVLELKRSFYDLKEWKPYPADYSNFYVLENLCNLSSNKFFIVYNKRTTKPVFFDDASKISIFSFNQGSPKKEGEFDFEQLFS
ncbi:hypothetical protein [Pseudoalteromonas sp. S3173]|uniref:hypothetical protein n=1 Tax=Pseudoalteromonas sp. S3173 TaxID=579531 RepID=UPI00110C8F88|nr:hypothetical protein [Pseudoalteromonas sp. S3173]TMS61768.1 hypothetical protein CWC10_10085 [Pseudoalteromonas sp. S3173]